MRFLPGLLLLIGLCAPGISRAETITCVYTEPFLHTVYATGGHSLTLTRAIENKTHRFRVSARVRDGHIDLVNRPQALRQTMIRDGKGSDGMSDTVFPWSATLTWKALPHRLHGGCR
jgi:uncharacterized membrane protein